VYSYQLIVDLVHRRSDTSAAQREVIHPEHGHHADLRIRQPVDHP
jgi:hypothetical protein